MDELLSVFMELLPLITVAGAVISGLIPRIGPGRAAFISIRSLFRKQYRESLRVAEIKLLRNMIADKDVGQGCLIITGETGVGKTCLLNTVTSKTAGVIEVRALASQSELTIVRNALGNLTNMPFDFIPPFSSAARVIFWYRLLNLGRSPIIVINAADRKVGQDYSGLSAAVRTLVDDYKLRVVVRGSTNAFDESFLEATCENVFEIKPMTKEMVWQIEQLQHLFEYVKKANLEDTVFAVLGGVPSRYENLWLCSKMELQTGRDAREVIGSHLCATVQAAIRLVKGSCGNDDRNIAKLLKLFQETSIFKSSTLVSNNIRRPVPDNVFREVEQNGEFVLIPASNAIEIVLRFHLTEEPTLDELEKHLNKEM